MGVVINTNVPSMNARGNLDQITRRLTGSYRRLSTGLRIVSAADDAAGLAISERMRAQIRSLGQAQRNANDGISLVQVGEGAMSEVSSILTRLRELSVQSANGTVSDSDKDTLQQEFSNLVEEVERIAQSTDFNGIKLLDGTVPNITFQLGSGTTAGVDTLTITLPSILSAGLGLDVLDIGSITGDPNAAILAIDGAIDTVVQARGDLGALQNRLDHTINNLGSQIENLSAAESRIRDVDVAVESAELTRNSILQQAAVTMLSQANVQPQIALSLLQG